VRWRTIEPSLPKPVPILNFLPMPLLNCRNSIPSWARSSRWPMSAAC
jgi:hypothetical protein